MPFCCTLLDAVEHNEGQAGHAGSKHHGSLQQCRGRLDGHQGGLGVKLHGVLHLLVIDPGGLGTPTVLVEVHNNTRY